MKKVVGFSDYLLVFLYPINSGISIVNTAKVYIAASIRSPVPEVIPMYCASSHRAPIPKTIPPFINSDFFVLKMAFKPQLRLSAQIKSGR